MNSRSPFLTVLAVTAAFSLPLHSQTPPDKETTMPQILQFGLGPGGTALPNDGTEYCGPTSMTMNIAWAGLAGHERLAPTSAAEQTQDFFINLDRTLGGLSQADGFDGTTVGGLMQGVALYLKMKGYSGNFTGATGGIWGPDGNGDGSSGVTTPTLADLTAVADSTETHLHFGSFLVGWYDVSGTTWEREGGHFLAVLSTTVPDTVVINNPYPNEGMPIQQTLLLSQVPGGIEGNSGGPNYNLGGYFNASDGMQYPLGGTMPPGYNTPVIEQWLGFSLPLAPPAVATWHLEEGNNAISIGLGRQDVLAPIADAAGGASSLNFSGGGRLTLTREATHTGGTSVSGATLASTITSGTPYGTGGLAITSGTLALQPQGSGGTVVLDAGGGTLSFSAGAALHLDLGAQNNLTFTVGDFFRSSDGTLVIAANSASQTATLGGNVKFLAGTTAPPVTAGMVSPAFIGQDATGGFFLTYDATDGFVAAGTVSGDINSLTGTPIYEANSHQVVSGTATVAALEVNAAVTGGPGSTVAVGAAGLEGAGVIFNGGSLAVETVALGEQTGYFYTGSAGGSVSSVVTGSSANGVNFFGPGTLNVSGTVAVTGPARVQSGTFALAEQGTLNVGSLVVGLGATFAQEGTVGSIGSPVPVSVAGTRVGSGAIFGNVTVEKNGVFSGAGTVTGDTVIHGTLSQLVDPNNPTSVLTFNGNVSFENEGFYNYNFASLDNTGLNDFFRVNGSLTFAEGAQMGLLFTTMDDPSTGNSFWDTNQIFLIASATEIVGFDNLDLNALDYANGYFWIGHDEGDLNLHWHAVPEPGTWTLLLAAGALALRRRRGRRE